MLMLLSSGLMAQLRYNSGGVSAKPKSGGFDPQKLVIGGGLGAGFGTGFMNAGIAPMVGYAITPNFLAGVSLGYQYSRFRDGNSFYNTTTNRNETYPLNYHLVSPGVWMRYNLMGSFFLHAQFEYHLGNLRWTGPAQYAGGTGKEKVKANYTIPTLLIGAGYRMPISDRAGMYFGLYYDVLQNSTQSEYRASNNQILSLSSPYMGLRPVFGFGIGL